MPWIASRQARLNAKSDDADSVAAGPPVAVQATLKDVIHTVTLNTRNELDH